jgi:hypothetical protein
LLPALEIVGIASTCTVTELLEAGQAPLEIVHTKTFAPVLRPVTVELFEDGVVTVAPPLETLQEPVPTDGELADNVTEEEQTVWLEPALEIVGGASTRMETVLVEAGQLPLVIVH